MRFDRNVSEGLLTSWELEEEEFWFLVILVRSVIGGSCNCSNTSLRFHSSIAVVVLFMVKLLVIPGLFSIAGKCFRG